MEHSQNGARILSSDEQWGKEEGQALLQAAHRIGMAGRSANVTFTEH